MTPRPVDFERRNRVGVLAGFIRSGIGVPHSRGEIAEAARLAANMADEDHMILHNTPKLPEGLKAGDECTVKLVDGSIIRGNFVKARGRKKVTIDSLGSVATGELVPDA